MTSRSPASTHLQRLPADVHHPPAIAPSNNANDPQSTAPGKRKSSVSAHDSATATSSTNNANNNHASSHDDGKKKRRKVNHACVYCRRSHMTCDLERPCARCVKRDIGHLCHDEPRDPPKKGKSEGNEQAHAAEHDGNQDGTANVPNGGFAQLHRQTSSAEMGDLHGQGAPAGAAAGPGTGAGPGPPPQLGQPPPISPAQLQRSATASSATANPGPNMDNFDWATAAANGNMSNQFQDMHHLHPNYMFNTSEATNEYKLLNDFLSSSLLDDGAMYSSDDAQAFFNDPLLATSSMNQTLQQAQQQQPPSLQPPQRPQSQDQQPQNPQQPPSQQPAQPPTLAPTPQKPGEEISRPPSVSQLNRPATESSRNRFYMTAADPSGHASAENRLHKLLKAKYDAGMLKPFNYVKGYARLNAYMSRHLTRESQIRILKQLDRFRPKFREAMQSLTDMQLVLVEMWFERSLMEYDRVFASMAIPACCWRRTGEIFRGNREMAELIDVPWEKLRDGKLAIHEVMREDSLVSYWEKFGAIAFDGSQKAILTSCSLRKGRGRGEGEGGGGGKEGLGEGGAEVKCCFSFTIRRDTHNIPSLIVGNFLPIKKRGE